MQLIQKIQSNPKFLFLVDGIGAAISSFMLGVVLVKFNELVGIPVSSLYILAAIPIVFVIYDIYGYRLQNTKWVPFLKGIAIMNVLYCFVSLAFALYHSGVITLLGWIYIIIEVIIILSLVVVELKTANSYADVESPS